MEASAGSSVIDALGISEQYTFHVRTTCEGSLSGQSSLDAKVDVIECSNYENKTGGMPSIFLANYEH